MRPRMTYVTILTSMLLFALAGCEGKQGPAGPSGPTGPTGPPGPGTRIIYQSGTKLPSSPNPYCINVPEVKLNDMPIISVYVGDDVGTWIEIPVYFDVPDYSAVAYIEEGQVCLLNCEGRYYKIIIVI